MNNTKEYFADTETISNSQLKTFIQYNKYGQRTLFPDDYIAMYIDKTVQFNVTDPVTIGKIVDRYFDGEGKDVWKYYIPVKKRMGKELQAVKEDLIKDKTIKYSYSEKAGEGKVIYLTEFEDKDKYDSLIGEGETSVESVQNLLTQHVNENYVEITMGMKDDAESMIARGLAFPTFKKFLKAKGTNAQVNLKEDVEITDKETGEVQLVKMKGLPDFVNDDLKLIVDLKTTGSRQMIIDDLQFKGEPKLTANYIRQLAIYNKLRGGDYDGALALVTDTGVKWIAIPNEYLVSAWDILEKDIVDLDKFLEDPTTLNESIFTYDESLDDLTL